MSRRIHQASDLRPYLKDFYVECDEARIHFVYTGPLEAWCLGKQVRVNHLSIMTSIFRVLTQLNWTYESVVHASMKTYANIQKEELSRIRYNPNFDAPLTFRIDDTEVKLKYHNDIPSRILKKEIEPHNYVFSITASDLVPGSSELDQTPDDYDFWKELEGF